MPRISAARASAQRERILDAALKCFAREGFHAATMQDIVAESGLSFQFRGFESASRCHELAFLEVELSHVGDL